MKYLELLAVERKPISIFNVEDLHQNTKYVLKAWKTWKATAVYSEMDIAKKYYNNENVFIKDWKRKAFFTLAKGNAIGDQAKTQFSNQEDVYKSEVKISNPLFKDMVDQIAGFILNNPIKMEGKSEDVKKLLEQLEKDYSFRHLLKTQLKETFIKGYAGTNYTMDNKQGICLEPIPAEAFGFFYKTTLSQEPEYTIISTEIENSFIETIDGKDKWSKQKSASYIVISKYQITKHSQNPADKTWMIEDMSYLRTTTKPTKQINEEGQTIDAIEIVDSERIELDALPFSLMTSPTLKSRLYDVKELIDALDINSTDAISELIRLIKNLWVLKGSDATTVDETLKLIDAGVINLDEEGDVKNLQGNEAIETRTKFNDHLKESFYRFAKVVDLEKLKSLSNTSSIAIKALYEPLNQISKDIESELERYIIDILKKVYMLENLEKSETIEDSMWDDVTITFSHSMLSNENEDLTANALQVGKVPEDIRLKNHPWTRDMSDDEIKAWTSEQKEKEQVV